MRKLLWRLPLPDALIAYRKKRDAKVISESGGTHKSLYRWHDKGYAAFRGIRRVRAKS